MGETDTALSPTKVGTPPQPCCGFGPDPAAPNGGLPVPRPEEPAHDPFVDLPPAVRHLVVPD